ncbi:hypothetical protein KAI87_09980, partial [Myxococcota bacterium]|nr:hypothetical protein [Myxococcota bacterium]
TSLEMRRVVQATTGTSLINALTRIKSDAGVDTIPTLHMDGDSAKAKAEEVLSDAGVRWTAALDKFVVDFAKTSDFAKVTSWMSRLKSNNIHKMMDDAAAKLGVDAPTFTYDMGKVDEMLTKTFTTAMMSYTPAVKKLAHKLLRDGADIYDLKQALGNLTSNTIDAALSRRGINLPDGVTAPAVPWDLTAMLDSWKTKYSSEWTNEHTIYATKAAAEVIKNDEMNNSILYSFSLTNLMVNLEKKSNIPRPVTN